MYLKNNFEKEITLKLSKNQMEMVRENTKITVKELI